MKRSLVEIREGQTLSQRVMLGIQNGPQSLTLKASSHPVEAWRAMEHPLNASGTC